MYLKNINLFSCALNCYQIVCKNNNQIMSSKIIKILTRIKYNMTESQVRNLLHCPSYREIYTEQNYLILLYIIIEQQKILCLHFNREDNNMPFILIKKVLIPMSKIAEYFK